MRRWIQLFVVVVVTWDAWHNATPIKKKYVDDYTGESGTYLESVYIPRHMKKTFSSKEAARDFLNAAPTNRLPIFGHDLKPFRERLGYIINRGPYLGNFKVYVNGELIFEDKYKYAE